MRAVKKGDIVKVTFLDHVEDGLEPLRCQVVGRLVSKGGIFNKRRYMVLESWFLDEVSRETQEANRKTWTILISTVESVVRLEEVSDGVFDKPKVRKGRTRACTTDGQHNDTIRES